MAPGWLRGGSGVDPGWLRAPRMYFLLANVAERFSMLKYGLCVILFFIGVKMMIIDLFHIPIGISLGVVSGILALTLIINAWANNRADRRSAVDKTPHE